MSQGGQAPRGGRARPPLGQGRGQSGNAPPVATTGRGMLPARESNPQNAPLVPTNPVNAWARTQRPQSVPRQAPPPQAAPRASMPPAVAPQSAWARPRAWNQPAAPPTAPTTASRAPRPQQPATQRAPRPQHQQQQVQQQPPPQKQQEPPAQAAARLEVVTGSLELPEDQKPRKPCLDLSDILETFNKIFDGKPPVVQARGNPGQEGRPIKLIMNMFNVQLPRGHVHHYDVDVYSIRSYKTEESATPIEKRSRCAATLVNRKVIEAFGRMYLREHGGCMPAYDGRKNMYTRQRLAHQGGDAVVEHIYNNIEIEENGERRVFLIRLRFVASLSFDHLHAFYERKQSMFENFQDVIQAADVILRTGPTLSFVPVGRSFFTPPQPNDRDVDISGKREVWFGAYCSIRLGSWKPVVNIDMSATAFYASCPLIDFLTEFLNKKNKSELSRGGLSDKDRFAVSRELRTLKVTAIHLRGNRRQHRIEGLSRRNANEESFEWEGKNVTIAQYFSRKYQIQLQFPNLPCVILGKKQTLLPMELCMLAPNQHCKKKLTEKQTSKMIKFTATEPRDRFNRILASAKQIDQSARSYLDEFEMKIETTPLEIEGRVLPAPVILYNQQKKQTVRDGTWRCDSFLKPSSMKKWAVACLGRASQNKTREMVQHLQREGRKLGMQITDPTVVENYGSRASPRSVLEDVKGRLPDVDITVVVLDRFSPYGMLKAEAETTDLCMRTQCVKDQNVEEKMNGMFAANLLQKINTKLGGQNNGIQGNIPASLKTRFMAIGMDVNHPAPSDSETPSVAAMVASLDNVPSQYHSCTSVQSNKRGQNQEYIVDTKNMFLECVTEYRKKNSFLPDQIFIFRDGVSEAQFSAVRMYELGAIRKACLEISQSFTPAVTFIVVQKRHHVRMMPKNSQEGVGRAKNVPPGTIVDTHIVNPGVFDFYLCSHQGIKGTSRPAHYHVVHDDKNHNPDDIYRLCYYLCHTYARCARAVSIPAPAYYAHLAAFRAKEYMKGRLLDGSCGRSQTPSSSGSSKDNGESLEKYQTAQRVIPQMRNVMYFV